jgi:hypothetical protein
MLASTYQLLRGLKPPGVPERVLQVPLYYVDTSPSDT